MRLEESSALLLSWPLGLLVSLVVRILLISHQCASPSLEWSRSQVSMVVAMVALLCLCRSLVGRSRRSLLDARSLLLVVCDGEYSLADIPHNVVRYLESCLPWNRRT